MNLLKASFFPRYRTIEPGKSICSHIFLSWSVFHLIIELGKFKSPALNFIVFNFWPASAVKHEGYNLLISDYFELSYCQKMTPFSNWLDHSCSFFFNCRIEELATGQHPRHESYWSTVLVECCRNSYVWSITFNREWDGLINVVQRSFF